MGACSSAGVHPHHSGLWEPPLPPGLRLQSSFLPGLVTMHTHVHVSKITHSGAWGVFLVNLLHVRMRSKIFWAFQGYKRIAMMCFPLVKKFQPLSIPVTKNTAAVSHLVCFFPSLLQPSISFQKALLSLLSLQRRKLLPSALSPFQSNLFFLFLENPCFSFSSQSF